MNGKDKKKQIPVPCEMFLRFLKEKGLFHEWRVEGENRVKQDFISHLWSRSQKFYSFAGKWQWCIANSSMMHGVILSNPIYIVIDTTLYWARTKRGHSFWANVNDTWMDIYRAYHEERQRDSMVYGKPITDDLETFIRIMKSEVCRP